MFAHVYNYAGKFFSSHLRSLNIGGCQYSYYDVRCLDPDKYGMFIAYQYLLEQFSVLVFRSVAIFYQDLIGICC